MINLYAPFQIGKQNIKLLAIQEGAYYSSYSLLDWEQFRSFTLNATLPVLITLLSHTSLPYDYSKSGKRDEHCADECEESCAGAAGVRKFDAGFVFNFVFIS